MPEYHYIAQDLGPEHDTQIAWAVWDWQAFAHWLEVWT